MVCYELTILILSHVSMVVALTLSLAQPYLTNIQYVVSI